MYFRKSDKSRGNKHNVSRKMHSQYSDKLVSPCHALTTGSVPRSRNYGLIAALISSYMMSTRAPPTPLRMLENAPLKNAPAPSCW